MDVVYAADYRVADSYNRKIEKYSPEFPNRVIPVVIKHNGEIYGPSMDLIRKHIPEVKEEYLCQIILYATVVYEATAQEDYTKKMKNGLMNGDLRKIYPRQYFS